MGDEECREFKISDAAGVFVEVFSFGIVRWPNAARFEFMKIFKNKKSRQVFVIAFCIAPNDCAWIHVKTIVHDDEQEEKEKEEGDGFDSGFHIK